MKRIDRYVFLRFAELFLATFFICSFVLLMQFMWKHINDIVGKGIDTSVLAEFFFYSSLTVVPLALPLAILLASLMAFGNLGEKFELTAMKAAGISLFRIMASLTTFILLISVGAFFFSNNVLPMSQKKLWTLIFSLRQASPELEIPTGEFYSGINGFNIYVRQKDENRKLLKNIMVYNYSKGFANASVTIADSARLQMSADKTYLLISLYNGVAFENLQDAPGFNSSSTSIPYRRETFKDKQFVIDFNTNFARLDESLMNDDYMSKNFSQLKETMDRLQVKIDSASTAYSSQYVRTHFFGRDFVNHRTFPDGGGDPLKADNLFKSLPKPAKNAALYAAINKMNQYKIEVENAQQIQHSDVYTRIRHGIELHRKFTLSVACLIFFFIGAPLGAIIRKGGLGVPIVISVLMFIVYYLIDNAGFKLAREDVWPIWKGIWLSTACLLPVGIFFTYKAATDSPIFNSEAYGLFFDKVKTIFSKFKKKKAIK